MDFAFLFIIWIVILVIVGIVLRCVEYPTDRKYVLCSGREFEVRLSPELQGAMCAVSIYEIVHPNRKFFRTKYRGSKTFWISDFETIKEGVCAMIDSYIIDEEEERLINEKWNEVK